MKKFVFLMTIIAVAYGFTVAVSAGTTGTPALEADYAVNEVKAQNIIDRANEKIDASIEEAYEKAELILMDYENGLITEEKKDMKIERLIDRLQTKTSRIADKAKEKAASLGVEVGCELQTVIIDGREVLIDPLFIIGT